MCDAHDALQAGGKGLPALARYATIPSPSLELSTSSHLKVLVFTQRYVPRIEAPGGRGSVHADLKHHVPVTVEQRHAPWFAGAIVQSVSLNIEGGTHHKPPSPKDHTARSTARHLLLAQKHKQEAGESHHLQDSAAMHKSHITQ